MHALVTGGGGFLGRYICEQLVARGDRVRSFGRGAYPELEALGVEVMRGDLTHAKDVSAACAGMEVVFHVAARPGVSVQSEPYYAVNTRGTQNVVDACRHYGVPRLVYTSSPSVVFAGEDQAGVDEAVPLGLEWLERHRSYYSHSKARAEQHVLSANCASLRSCALRPHLIWGPRDQHLIPRLIARARSGRLRRVGDGSNEIDMIFVENAAQAHLQAADALAEAGIGSVIFAHQLLSYPLDVLSHGLIPTRWIVVDERVFKITFDDDRPLRRDSQTRDGIRSVANKIAQTDEAIDRASNPRQHGV